MKNIFIFSLLLIIASCASTDETEKTNNGKPENEAEVAKTETEILCFENKIELCSEKEGKFLICNIRLELTKNQIVGKLDCQGCPSSGSEGSTDYIGTQRGDTLEIVESYLDGELTIKTYGLWLMRNDSLVLLAQADDEVSLKKQKKTPLLLYLKKQCD